MNALKVLDLALHAHKSISFARVDGQIRCTTAAGSRSAPDLETLLRDLGTETADSLVYANSQRAKQIEADRDRAVDLFSAIDEGPLPAPPKLPTIPDRSMFESDAPQQLETRP